MAQHVGRLNTLGRRRIVSTAGRMYMMIAREPAELCDVYPALHAERFCLLLIMRSIGDFNISLENTVFRATCVRDVKFAEGQQYFFTIAAVDLIVEEKIWSQTT